MNSIRIQPLFDSNLFPHLRFYWWYQIKTFPWVYILKLEFLVGMAQMVNRSFNIFLGGLVILKIVHLLLNISCGASNMNNYYSSSVIIEIPGTASEVGEFESSLPGGWSGW